MTHLCGGYWAANKPSRRSAELPTVVWKRAGELRWESIAPTHCSVFSGCCCFCVTNSPLSLTLYGLVRLQHLERVVPMGHQSGGRMLVLESFQNHVEWVSQNLVDFQCGNPTEIFPELHFIRYKWQLKVFTSFFCRAKQHYLWSVALTMLGHSGCAETGNSDPSFCPVSLCSFPAVFSHEKLFSSFRAHVLRTTPVSRTNHCRGINWKLKCRSTNSWLIFINKVFRSLVNTLGE